MDQELRVFKKCIANDEVLTSHVKSAMTRGLPVVGQYAPHDMVAIMVGCGPSVVSQLDSIRKQKERGRPIFAMVWAHDWLIDHGIIPDVAVVVDPQDKDWFKRPNPNVDYFIASQCHPSVFDRMKDYKVELWHLNFGDGSAFPPCTKLINGGSSTGLRAIVLLHTMGFGRFELYGFDSCLKDGLLRVNGDLPKPNQKVVPIRVGKRWFKCNPAMAVQADEFQDLYKLCKGITIQSHGDGLITAIIDERERVARDNQEVAV